MSGPIYNLHNHTPFSDGAYTIDEICAAHHGIRDLTIDGVGISDHLFCTPSSHEAGDAAAFERVFGHETRRYVAQIDDAKTRWEGRLRVLCGCEINWPLNKRRLDSIRGMLAGFDYVLFEQVDWPGLTQLANQARRWPCPIGLAHTDVPRQFPNTSLDQVVRTMANARLFYEVNAKYLSLSNGDRWFSILPKHRVHVSLGTDTHDDLECVQQLGPLVEFVRRRGLFEQLIPLPATSRSAAGVPQSA